LALLSVPSDRGPDDAQGAARCGCTLLQAVRPLFTGLRSPSLRPIDTFFFSHFSSCYRQLFFAQC
jgi:hypothetical protein